MQRWSTLWTVFLLVFLLVAVTASSITLTAADLPTASPESVGMSSARLSRLDAAVQADIGAGRLPGIVVAVARRGKVVYQKAFGVPNMATGEPMRTDAVFRLYSMTKPIASVGLLTLYEQGKFRLTDPLDLHLPQFANVKAYKGADASGNPLLAAPSRKPTIQDAFRHTLGLASGLGPSPVDALYRQAGLSMGQLDLLGQEMDKLATVPLLYDPGERWVYGLGHDVQARLIEVFSGVSYGDYLQRTISAHLACAIRCSVSGRDSSRASRWSTPLVLTAPSPPTVPTHTRGTRIITSAR